MANWQLILNISGLAIVFYAGKFAKSALNHWYAGSTVSCLLSGSLLFSAMTLALLLFHMALMKPPGTHSLKSLFLTYFTYHILIPILGRILHRKQLKEMEDPQKYQDELLMSILEENGKTDFSIDHGLDKIKSREEFIKKFPLTDYSAYEKYVNRIAKGEDNVMTKAKVVHLCITSGTTGKNKMYPLTNRDLKSYEQFFLAFMKNSLKEQGMKLDRVLAFKLSNPVRKSSGGITIGGLTASRKPNHPSDVIPAVHSKVMKEEPSYFIQALFGLREKEIGMIQGYSSDLMYSFFKSMEHNKEKIARALETGHIEPFPELEEDVREELNKLLTPDEDRAEDLRDIFAEGSEGLAKRLWPKLNFTMLASTGGFHHAAKILEETYLKGVKYGLGFHIGTEGFYGIGMSHEDLKDEICTFIPGSVFLEFIKVEDMEEENPTTYLLKELEVGQLYELVVTNWHGLYRNRFGDVIKVVGFTNKCPKYIFQYRTGQILNCGLDRTPEKAFYDALTETELQWNVTIQNYTTTESLNLEAASGVKLGRIHYVAFIELEKGIFLTREQQEMLEENLCKRQESYAEFRGVNSLGPVNIIQVKPGTFNGLRSLMLGDRLNMQYKTPRVIRREELLVHLWNNRIV